MSKPTKFLPISIMILLNLLAFQPVAATASLTLLSDTMTRETVSIASDHIIKFTTPSGVAAGQKIQIDFPAGFVTTGVLYSDMTLSAPSAKTLGATVSGTTWGASFTGQQLNIVSGTDTIAPGATVVLSINGVHKIVNPSTPSTYRIGVGVYNGGTAIDTGQIGIVTVTNDSFVVNATVDPTLSFSLSANSVAFNGTLVSTSATSTVSPITLTTSTNADNGYAIAIRDEGNGANPGLYSSGTGSLIGSANASYATTADLGTAISGYGLQASSASATISSSPVNYGQTGNLIGGLSRTLTSLASSSAPASAHTLNLTLLARVLGSTPAGQYTDTVTVIATANF
jgi:hypothetical protein